MPFYTSLAVYIQMDGFFIMSKILILEVDKIIVNSSEFFNLVLSHNNDQLEEQRTTLYTFEYDVEARASMAAIHAYGMKYNSDGTVSFEDIQKMIEICRNMSDMLTQDPMEQTYTD